ncbi:MAG: hypothetical protein GWM90_18120, partial [Gemmatimonadetes bacterium]|nr:hypothetical protein [Gemmatimonadota bacterium]NIQ56265.1 hypothetical protein [Gemmatimonadota bacterium]NIU76453.1 hypothetical protein [Gammaproteobacteria bacterium]NIX45937.1 hypothetical protein [Gemmatimonadota bacterium]NIY10258.1 hypothetical protein [Gemmatimonadota bacterium]
MASASAGRRAPGPAARLSRARRRTYRWGVTAAGRPGREWAGRREPRGVDRDRDAIRMELFEFLMILVSIIIGLGVTEVLSGAARLLRARDGVRPYWIHVLLQVGVFLALIQNWWESWDLRLLPELSYVQACVLLLGPIILFLMAHLLYPDPVPGADLRAYYYRQSPILWGLVVAGTAVGTFLKPVVFDWPVLYPSNLSGLVTIPFALVLASSRSPRLHAVLATAILLILVLDT